MSLRDLVNNLLRPAHGKVAAATKSSLAGPLIAWSQVGQPKWTHRRYDQLAEQGFRKNVIAFRCVMQVSTAASAIPWLLYDPLGEELDRHPLPDLLRHPNPLQDGTAFLESVYAYLQIAGNAYIEAVKPDEGTAPVELYALRPDRMKVIPGPAGLPEAYQYTVNGQVTTWPADPITGESNILHIRQFHPLDDWYGMAPLEAAQVSVDQHNAAGSWNQALLNHGARPSGALVYAPKDGSATLTDEQIHRLREELGSIYQGSRNAGRPLILEGGLDWREMSLSPKDMDWLAGRNVAARDIALAFGVPAQLVGIPDSQTYANMAEARMALYEETVLPLVNRVMSAFEHWLVPMYDEELELDYDPDEVSALAVRRDVQWNKLQATDFLTINEKRHAIGYGPVEGGDVLDSVNKKPNGSSPNAEPITSIAPTALISPYNAPFSTETTSGPKFNPNHDELGRFTFGPGGTDDDSDDNQSGDSSDTDGSYDDSSNTGSTGDFGPGIFGLPKKPSGLTQVTDNDEEETSTEAEVDPLADAKIEMYNSAADTLRELDPNNPLLNQLTNPDSVPTPQDTAEIRQAIADASRQNVMNFLMLGGSPVGTQGNGIDIRMLNGDLATAQRDFEALTIGGETLNLPNYDGTMVQLPGNGGLIGLRTDSSDGLPTLDFKVPGFPFRSIHYK